jgi:hypothetical protein
MPTLDPQPSEERMKIMLNHSSATPHTIKSTKAGQEAGAVGRSRKTTISNALRRRAQAVINDRSIDAESRAIIRYGLETNDPLLAELVRRVDAGEAIIETIVVLKHPKLTPRIPIGKRSKR